MNREVFNIGDIDAALYQRKKLQLYSDTKLNTFQWSHLKWLISSLLKKRNYTYRNNDSKVLFVYPHDYYHASHYLYYKNVIDYFPEYDAFYYDGKNNGIRLKYLIDFMRIPRLLIKAKYGPLNTLYACTLAVFPTFFDGWKNVNIEKYELVVLYNEMSPISSYIVQRCRNKGIKTATLQHGEMAGINPNKPGFLGSGHMLKDSQVDYFLGWNSFTREEAIRSGMSKDKFFVMGMPGYLGKKKIEHNQNKTIGVILSAYHELNEKTVTIAREYAKKCGYKYYARIRQADDINNYKDLFDENYLDDTAAETVLEFASKVEFLLCAPTSCFVELVSMGAEVYRLNCDKDVYSSMEAGKVSNDGELIDARNQWIKVKGVYENYIGAPTDAEIRYREFFKKFA